MKLGYLLAMIVMVFLHKSNSIQIKLAAWGKLMDKKRKLIDELMVGVEFMQLERKGEIYLHTHEVDDLLPLQIDADLIRETLE